MKRLISGIGVGITLAAAIITTLPAQRTATPPIPNLAGKVMTVAGPIDPSALGQTLSHEHIFIDFTAPPPMVPAVTGVSVLKAPQQAAGRGGGLTDFDESLAEIEEFRKIGGGTIVDVTNFGLTRDPEALLRVQSVRPQRGDGRRLVSEKSASARHGRTDSRGTDCHRSARRDGRRTGNFHSIRHHR